MRNWDKLGNDLSAVWDDADGLVHAFNLADSGISDVRGMHRARRRLEAMGFELPSIQEKHYTAKHIECPSTFEVDNNATSFVITSCTNDSTLNHKFLTTLEMFSLEHGAELVVVPVNYLNVTSMTRNSDYAWDSRIYQYALLDDHLIDDSVLISSARIRATAVNPLSGMQPIGKQNSVIYGHPQLAMEMVAAPSTQTPKMMHTTGSCNQAEYSDTKDGAKAGFHHSEAAIFVHVRDDGSFDLNQLCWDGKGFNFFQERWSHSGRKENQNIAALHMGDYHTRAVHQDVIDWRAQVITRTDPEALIWNDLHDHYSQNHHHTKMDRVLIASKGLHLVEDEIELSVNAVNAVGEGRMNYIVESNHDDALMKWMNEFKDDRDPHNAPFYWELMAKKFAFPEVHALELAMADALEVDYQFIDRNHPLNIKGIDVSQHGDVGPNGGRGSVVGFARTTYKTIIGHCLTAAHQVLTKSGWRDIETTPVCELLSYDSSTDRNVWATASEKIDTTYTGRLLRLGHTAFSQEVTTGHHLKLKNGDYLPISEAILTRSASELPITALPLEYGERTMPENLIRQIVAVCADASFYTGTLHFHLSKQRKVDRVAELFGESANPAKMDAAGTYKVLIRKDSSAYADVTEYVATNTAEKRLPEIFLEFNEECRDIVLDELQYWDGTFKCKGSAEQFSTCKEEEANLVATLATFNGYRTSLSQRVDAPGYVVTWSSNRDHAFVTALQHDKARIESWRLSTREVVDEPVFCFTIPETQCFWVRNIKTGKISLTGNSHTPRIYHGCWQNGTSSKDMGYNKGFSSWMICDILIYQSGKTSFSFYLGL